MAEKKLTATKMSNDNFDDYFVKSKILAPNKQPEPYILDYI